jgi:citronellyl-CoA dehydrogenase
MLTTFFREEHELFRKSVSQYLEKEVAPHVEEWEANELFPREVFRRCGELGFLGAHYPEDVGGAGGDWWYAAAWGEALVKSRCAGLAMALMVQSDMATPIIGELGTREQKDEFLGAGAAGREDRGARCLGAQCRQRCGIDSHHRSPCRRRLRDQWRQVLDHQRHPRRLHHPGGTHRSRELRLWRRVARHLPDRCQRLQGHRKIKKMGNHASDTAELSFEDCRIPARYLLGEENHGFYYIMMNFQGERLIAAVSAVAGAQQCLDETIKYTQDRTAFGRPILKFQVWRHTFAELATQIEAARWLTYRAVDLYNRKEEAVKEITMAKLFAGELAIKVADRCVQAHGGYGYAEEFPIARYYRDVRLVTIGGGTSEVMKEIISKRLGWG